MNAMNPEQQPPDYSIDYLNRIAPQPQKTSLFGKPKLLFILLSALLVVIIFALIAARVVHQSPNSLQVLAARLNSTEKIASDAQSNLQSSQLRSLNSSLKIFLANANRDIVAPLASNGVNTAKLDKSIVASESGADLSAKLEDARLNAVYDRTYAREMAYRLDTIILLMKQIETGTHSQSLQSFLQTSTQNLTPIQKQFADFNAANG